MNRGDQTKLKNKVHGWQGGMGGTWDIGRTSFNIPACDHPCALVVQLVVVIVVGPVVAVVVAAAAVAAAVAEAGHGPRPQGLTPWTLDCDYPPEGIPSCRPTSYRTCPSLTGRQ
jgi:hypothetical protein